MKRFTPPSKMHPAVRRRNAALGRGSPFERAGVRNVEEAMMQTKRTAPRPRIVSADEFQAARDRLLVKEKAMTRALDALAAEHRRLPMVADKTEAVTDLIERGAESNAR